MSIALSGNCLLIRVEEKQGLVVRMFYLGRRRGGRDRENSIKVGVNMMVQVGRLQ